MDDIWPGHLGEQRAASSTDKGKGKAQDKKVEGPWRYPVLDHGALGAATLQKLGKKHKYTWTFAAEERNGMQTMQSTVIVLMLRSRVQACCIGCSSRGISSYPVEATEGPKDHVSATC